MGYPGSFPLVLYAAVLKIEVAVMWMELALLSVVSLLLGRGWESPSARMLSTPLGYLLELDAPEADRVAAVSAETLAAKCMESIPEIRFGDISSKFANEDCSVCLCSFTAQETVRQIPHCSHVFHKDCLDRWMAHHQTTCPLCRSSFAPVERQEEPEAKQATPVPPRPDGSASGRLWDLQCFTTLPNVLRVVH